MSRPTFYIVYAILAAFFLWSIAIDLLELHRTSIELDRLTKWVAADSVPSALPADSVRVNSTRFVTALLDSASVEYVIVARDSAIFVLKGGAK